MNSERQNDFHEESSCECGEGDCIPGLGVVELTEEERKIAEEQFNNPLLRSDYARKILSAIGNFKPMLDDSTFQTIEEKYFPERIDDNPNNCKVEIPIFRIDF